MTKRRVVDHDLFFSHTFGLQIGLKDFVGCTRVDVVSSHQNPALHLFVFKQIIDCWDGLLVGGCAGVKDVPLAFLTLILYRIEKDAVQLFKDWQNRFAGDGSPVTEYC